MTGDALPLALAAALVHALWNVLVGSARDPRPAAAVAMVVGIAAALPIAVATWDVQRAAVPWIAASAALELAYIALLAHGRAGEIYNVSRGEGLSLNEMFRRLAEIIGVQAEPTPDPSLVRGNDINHLVGDSSKLRKTTGWSPTITLDQTLRDVVDAETH